MPLQPPFLLATLAAVFIAGVSRAQESRVDDTFVQVSALFEAGWKPSSKGLAAAEALYRQIQAGGRPDPRLSYAFALVQMRNQKYDDARKLLDLVLAADKTNVHVRRAKTWVLMITQKHSAALLELESTLKSMAAAQADAGPETDAGRLIQFAGRVMGFIDGPAGSALGEPARAGHRKRLLGMLTGEQRQTFVEGYAFVQRRFAELNLDRQQTTADAKADEQRRQERNLEELERERAKLAQHSTQLRERAETVVADFKETLTTLDSQHRPLAARQARLEARAAAMVREMAGLEVEIARLLELASLVEDPVEALQLQAEARRLDLALGRYRVNLRTIEAELSGVAAQRIALARQQQVAVAQQRANADRLERRAADLRRAERRISSQEDRANQPASGVTGAVVSLSNRAKAFTTYDEFPFEEERARLLQSLTEP